MEWEIVDDDDCSCRSHTLLNSCATLTKRIASQFIGLVLAPKLALIDTGAQHAVCGPTTFRQIKEVLKVEQLCPRIIPTLEMEACGVGGSTKFVQSAEIPIAMCFTFSGIMTVHVVPSEIPLLLAVSFLKALGMILDMPEMQCHWKHLDCTSPVYEASSGGHLAVDIFEFPKHGWICPHETRNPLLVPGCQTDRSIKRADYEYKGDDNSILCSNQSVLAPVCDVSDVSNAEPASMPNHGHQYKDNGDTTQDKDLSLIHI